MVSKFCAFSLSVLLFSGLSGCQRRRQPNLGAARACSSNLSNYALAVEMYAGDTKEFPTSLAELKGDYLMTLPECDAGGVYAMEISPAETVKLYCQGEVHSVAGLAKDTPSLTVTFRKKNGAVSRVDSKLEPSFERMRYNEDAPDANRDTVRPE